jgi:hypothetical protein
VAARRLRTRRAIIDALKRKALEGRSWGVSRVGVILGLAIGIIDVLLMLPLAFADKRARHSRVPEHADGHGRAVSFCLARSMITSRYVVMNSSSNGPPFRPEQSV